MRLDHLVTSGLFPDFVIRLGIRYLLSRKLKLEYAKGVEQLQAELMQFVSELKELPIAIQTNAANKQHYEVPAEFYTYALGPNRKYSSGLWDATTQNLAQAEENMLALTVERAEVKDGMSVLDLGCGWGALSLYLAKHFPNSKVTGFSNSHSQREYIEEQARQRGMTNLTIKTGNIVDYEFDQQFDRIISVEMFEHMKNYQLLFEKVSRWMNVDAKLFVHIFTHKSIAYHFVDEGEHDWLTRYFFEGGTMPSNDLFHYFQNNLKLLNQWSVCGTHYQKTARAWLEIMDGNKQQVLKLFSAAENAEPANVLYWRWRLFFMACEELWGFDNGAEWMVSHYLFEKR